MTKATMDTVMAAPRTSVNVRSFEPLATSLRRKKTTESLERSNART